MANTKLTRTPASNGNSKTWTWSAWVKLSEANTEYVLFHNFGATTNDEVYAKIGGSDGTIEFALRYGGTYEGRLITNRKFRDVSGWYNFVFVCDTPNATAGDRQRIYVNGVEETSFSTDTQIAQNAGTVYNQTYEHTIGSYGSGNYFNGSMSHINAVDGTAYDASYFGSTNSTTGQWEINTSPTVTYGTNGYFILKDSNSVTDQSGNANNWTVASGTLSNTKDNPSNVFCTWNELNPYTGTIENGSLRLNNGSSFDCSGQGTIGMTSGKYYWEYKMGGTHGEFGVCEQGKSPQTDPQSAAGNYFIYNNGSNTTGTVYNNVSGSSSSTVTVTAFVSDMICGCAYDADNQALYFHQNGTYVNSGDPTSGASKTGAIITDLRARYGGTIVPFMGFGTSSARTNFDANFGNGVFGDTAISSAGTNASGLGVFEYDVPTGYTAVCTKGLNL